MSTFLILRPRGPYSRVRLGSGTVVEYSVDALQGNNLAIEIEGARLDAIILEDLQFSDLDDRIRLALIRGGAGCDCPIVTRWTRP